MSINNEVTFLVQYTRTSPTGVNEIVDTDEFSGDVAWKLAQCSGKYHFRKEEFKEFISVGKQVVDHLGRQYNRKDINDIVTRYNKWVQKNWDSTTNRQDAAIQDISQEILLEEDRQATRWLAASAKGHGLSKADCKEFVSIGKALIGYLGYMRGCKDLVHIISLYNKWAKDNWNPPEDREYRALRDIGREMLPEKHQIENKKAEHITTTLPKRDEGEELTWLQNSAKAHGFSGEDRKEFIAIGKELIGYLGYMRNKKNVADIINRYNQWTEANWHSAEDRRYEALRDIGRQTLPVKYQDQVPLQEEFANSHEKYALGWLRECAGARGFSEDDSREYIAIGKELIGYLGYVRNEKDVSDIIARYDRWVEKNWESAEDRRYEALRDIGREMLPEKHQIRAPKVERAAPIPKEKEYKAFDRPTVAEVHKKFMNAAKDETEVKTNNKTATYWSQLCSYITPSFSFV